jgi:site-specific DNA-methyltransferase (adenine-specific)
MIELLKGDCLEVMKSIEDNSIDAIITDPPYGTTACKWDSVIDFGLMWEQLNRIIKPNGAIVLFGSEPFSSALRMSNIKNYKYQWYWQKERGTGFQLSKYQPLKRIEDIIVFGNAPTSYTKKGFSLIYNPQMKKLDKPYKHVLPRRKTESLRNGIKTTETGESIYKKYTHSFPNNIIQVARETRKNKHPTQKPVLLMEYLIKTYTNENETVLDFTMGSGTTGVACVNLNRQFIGIEQDENYYNISVNRIEAAKKELNKLTLFK